MPTTCLRFAAFMTHNGHRQEISDLVASTPVNELAIKVKFTEISTRHTPCRARRWLVGRIGGAPSVRSAAALLSAEVIPYRCAGPEIR